MWLSLSPYVYSKRSQTACFQLRLTLKMRSWASGRTERVERVRSALTVERNFCTRAVDLLEAVLTPAQLCTVPCRRDAQSLEVLPVMILSRSASSLSFIRLSVPDMTSRSCSLTGRRRIRACSSRSRLRRPTRVSQRLTASTAARRAVLKTEPRERV